LRKSNRAPCFQIRSSNVDKVDTCLLLATGHNKILDVKAKAKRTDLACRDQAPKPPHHFRAVYAMPSTSSLGMCFNRNHRKPSGTYNYERPTTSADKSRASSVLGNVLQSPKPAQPADSQPTSQSHSPARPRRLAGQQPPPGHTN